ncbi:transcriptional regulator [Actinoplanes sp. SE50]|uniref:response regulator transcription factor n=1 Tax=unclassified Actinoplanes TaxID=2626549 RepID=UPI00023ED608|nr:MULTISPECIES: response regulator transcription factor [unclassified Actinoplanes]AEV85012.1 Transcriptional regulatory protein uhpA [Actinoplanes sp. SE50/110]ATO83403.1 transcriptional regulator [Actinoplanes sp. SE50]SLM00810.1 two-component system response regulator LuxR family [Actinoplanes sp. SE50/110]
MIRILLVEPLTLLRGALTATLSQEDDLDVVADLDALGPALDMAGAVSPDVAVINIALMAGDGLATIARFTAGQPRCATLALAGPDESVLLNRALGGRIDGVVNTQAAPCELVRGIRRLVRGERVIDASLAVAMVTAPRSPLSSRELTVLSVAASGMPSTEMAAELHLSPGTVRNYLSAILRKTGARNRWEAVRLAENAGWLT